MEYLQVSTQTMHSTMYHLFGNTAVEKGGGAYIDDHCSNILEKVVATNNTAKYGGGIC